MRLSSIWPILAKFLDMDFKFVLPLIYINFDIQTNFEILQKITKMAKSQNPIFPKCHSLENLLLLHFSMNLPETFRINVNMDFAHTNRGRFLKFRPPKKS